MRMVGAACPPAMSTGSATGCVAFATAGGRERYGFGDVEPRVRAWIAHAENAQTWRLRHAIFWGGRFDPAFPPKPGRPLAGVGSRRFALRNARFQPENNTQRIARPAYRNRNSTGKRNNNLGFRAGSTLFARAGAITVSPGAHLSVQGRS